jgi:hypothetical protein
MTVLRGIPRILQISARKVPRYMCVSKIRFNFNAINQFRPILINGTSFNTSFLMVNRKRREEEGVQYCVDDRGGMWEEKGKFGLGNSIYAIAPSAHLFFLTQLSHKLRNISTLKYDMVVPSTCFPIGHPRSSFHPPLYMYNVLLNAITFGIAYFRFRNDLILYV